MNKFSMRLLNSLLSFVLLCFPAAAIQDTGISSVSALKAVFEAGVERNGIVGASLKVLRNGALIAEESRGFARESELRPIDENTAFHWASITKTFTAIGILQLRDHGLLQLDDPITKYVPELSAVHDPWGPVQAITIRHLLTHSGGFRSATWPWGGDKPWQPFEPVHWSQIVAMLPYTEVEFAPGSKYSYSNLGYVFLGQVIERLSGDDYEVFIDKNILKPLEMYATYFDKAPYLLLKNRSASYTLSGGKLAEAPFDFDTGITVSNGGLNAPLRDMVKYVKFLLGDPSRSELYEGILRRSSLEEMFEPQLPIASGTPPLSQEKTEGTDFIGLCFFIHEERGRKFIGHSGGQNGFISHFYIQPASHNAYLVAFNTDAKDALQNTRRFDGELRDYIFSHLFLDPNTR